MLLAASSDLPARIACYGSGGTGVQWTMDVRHMAGGSSEFIGYVDDFQDPRRRVEPGYEVLSFDDLLGMDDVGVFVPVLDNPGRRKLFSKLQDHGIPIIGARGPAHLSHPAAELGEGTLTLSTTRLGHSTRIGRGCLVMADLVAHDSEIGDFTSLGFGSIVLGHVQVGNDVFIGTGAIIHNGTLDRPLTIGDGAVIGAGAVVTHDVAPGQVMVGPRALPLDEWRALLGSRAGSAPRAD